MPFGVRLSMNWLHDCTARKWFINVSVAKRASATATAARSACSFASASERLSVKSSDDERQLLALIAHEFRSPAAVVSGYLRLLLREDASDLPERARHMIEEADRSSARVLHLVKELAELADLADSESRASSSPVRVFSLCAEVAQAAARAEDGLEVAFSCASEDQPALVRGDEQPIETGADRAHGRYAPRTWRETPRGIRRRQSGSRRSGGGRRAWGSGHRLAARRRPYGAGRVV